MFGATCKNTDRKCGVAAKRYRISRGVAAKRNVSGEKLQYTAGQRFQIACVEDGQLKASEQRNAVCGGREREKKKFEINILYLSNNKYEKLGNKMDVQYISLIMLLVLFTISKSKSEEVNESENFVEVLKATGTLLKYCWIKASKSDADVVDGVQVCLRRASLLALDRIIEDDVVELPYGMQLVKIGNNSEALGYKRDVEKLEAGSDREWSLQVIARIESIFKTHVLRLPAISDNEIVEGRGRRKNNNDIVLFGVLAMTIIAIPLGFQFLAVLGGKALLLAKLALILTSIQGLKKIATSDLHYGFYSTAGHGGSGPPTLGGLGGIGGIGKPWFYDRKWQQNLPERHTFDSYSDLPDQQTDLYSARPRISIVGGHRKLF